MTEQGAHVPATEAFATGGRFASGEINSSAANQLLDQSTHYGRALLAEHFKPFDLIFSAGPYCRPAFHLRRLLDRPQAYPFDWWGTPAMSTLRMLAPDYRFFLTVDDIHLTHSGRVAVNSRDQILQLHDFRLAEDGTIEADSIGDQLAEVNSKYQFLFERLRHKLHSARRCLILFEGFLESADLLEPFRKNSSCPQLSYTPLPNDFSSSLITRLKEDYRVEAIVATLGFGTPTLQTEGSAITVTAPILPSCFDQAAEPYQRPWASYDLLLTLLASALAQHPSLRDEP